jgi:primase-polymerase (primpol)-like protein
LGTSSDAKGGGGLNFANIPQELKDNSQMCLWKYEQRSDKPTKVPYNPKTGGRAQPNNPDTFASYSVTRDAYQRGGYDGIGIGIFDDYAAVDIDHCFRNGTLSDMAQYIIQTMDSYTEVSPSGTGIRILFKAPGFSYDKAKYYIKHPRSGLEVYVAGATRKYVTVTGNVLHRKPIAMRNAEIAAVLEAYMKKPQHTAPKQNTDSDRQMGNGEANLDQGLEKDEKLRELWNGLRPNGNESSDDLALMNKLAYWCQGDPNLMRQAFMSSPYYAQKTAAQKAKCDHRPDYLPATIQKAIDGLQSSARKDYAASSPQVLGEFPGNTWPHKTDNGKPIKHWENTKWSCDRTGIRFRFNEMSKEIETEYEPYQKLSFDSIITDLRGRCAVEGYTLTKSDMADHIMRIAEENAYNPVRDYLNSCLKRWDGKGRICELFDMFILDPDSEQDPEFLFTLFKKWLITCAKLPFNEGKDAAQGVLVLIGPQGIGKTRWGAKLLPDPNWGKSGRMIDMRDKDTLIQALQYWVVELGEYGRNLSAEKSDHYKAFVTESCDIFRAPYARSAEKYPRTTVFYATTDTDAFLKDDAGERRNWTIKLAGIQDKDIDIDQLWGEVAHMALVEKRPHWLTGEEVRRLNRQNEVYKARSSEYELLFDSFNWDAEKKEWIWLTSTETCRVLNLDSKRVVQIGRALCQMKALGVIKSKNTGCKKYLVPPLKDEWAMRNVRQQVNGYMSQSITVVK